MADLFTLLPNLFSERIVSLLTFFFGLLIGHHTALLRDLRKEFNEAAAPVREWLLKEAERPSVMGVHSAPCVVEIDRLVLRLHWWQRKGFLSAWEQQRAARKQPLLYGPMGGAGYTNPEAVTAALKACLTYTSPR